MANTDSARKRIRQTEKRTARNKARKSRVRTYVRKLEEAIATGDKAVAQEAFRAAQPEMQRAVDQGHAARQHRVAEDLSPVRAREVPGRRPGLTGTAFGRCRHSASKCR